jgi:hypothetical protein
MTQANNDLFVLSAVEKLGFNLPADQSDDSFGQIVRKNNQDEYVSIARNSSGLIIKVWNSIAKSVIPDIDPDGNYGYILDGIKKFFADNSTSHIGYKYESFMLIDDNTVEIVLDRGEFDEEIQSKVFHHYQTFNPSLVELLQMFVWTSNLDLDSSNFAGNCAQPGYLFSRCYESSVFNTKKTSTDPHWLDQRAIAELQCFVAEKVSEELLKKYRLYR